MIFSSILSLIAVSSVHGFAPSGSAVAFSRSFTTNYNWQLNDIIKADAADFRFDQGQGGVRLAEETAIKLVGSVEHGPGKATPDIQNLLRYTKVVEVEDSVVQEIMEKVGATLVTTGLGKELYKDPGETTTKEVTLAPHDAIRDAFIGAGSVTDSASLFINFLGGNDLIFDEVRDAVKELVLELSPPTKSKISFNSLCHHSFPLGSATVTVLSKSAKPDDEGGTGGVKGVEKSVACGEVYFREGKWWTVVEDDINTDTA